MDKLRWALIGCGDISRKRVAPALVQLDSCELVSVSRARGDLAASFAREFGASRWYGSWEDALKDDDIDAVYIATPVHLHAEQTVAAAEAGKHVLCEKPLALDAAGCDRMISACDSHGVMLGTAYYRHFYPVVNRVREILESGEIGQPVLAEVRAFEWFDRKPGEPRAWLLDREKAGGGPMMDFGCHRIEVLLSLFGKVRNVQSGLYNLHFSPREVEDTAQATLLFEAGVKADLQVTHASRESRDSFEIFGTEGSLSIPVLNEGNLLIRSGKGEREEYLPPHRNFHLPLIEDFANAVREKRSPGVDGIAGREVSLILDRIYRR